LPPVKRTAFLEALGIQRHANAVMPQDLARRSARASKSIEIAGMHVLLEGLMNLQSQ
jgi:hypothetical protein